MSVSHSAGTLRSRVGYRGLLSALALGLLLGGAILASFLPTAARVRVDSVHAERAGLRLGTQALSGRVTLVASEPGTRWRIVGLTDWRQASGNVLLSGWDTTRVPDGTYHLELSREHRTSQKIVVRNYTPLPDSPLANASAGLNTRSDDARSVVATFTRRSYRPRDLATIEIWRRYDGLVIQLLRIGPGRVETSGNQGMNGVRVGSTVRVKGSPRTVRFRLGRWPSGLYAARLTTGQRVGYAVFVLRPRRLGEHRVAVVQPTNTWQAYNYRCANGDGVPDTWYYTSSCTTVDQSRPFLDRGVPPHFRAYDLGFLRWLAKRGHTVDMLAQEDLERVSGDRLARLYRLIVFPGHHEYVTTAEYDAVQRFRDLGGSLAFLSANNFFSRVDRDGDRLTRIGRWRDLGRPEASLVGVQYFQWDIAKVGSRQYVVRGAARAPWLFAGTGLRNGDRLGWWGIEVDARTAASPRSVVVVASMPNALGTRRAAEMTYYETARGARVFAAGAFTLAGTQATRWTTGKVLDNLWRRLTNETRRPREGDIVRARSARSHGRKQAFR